MATVIRTTTNEYLERIMRRVAPLIAITIMILALMVIRGLIAETNQRTAAEHDSGLDNLNTALLTELEQYRDDLLSVATDRSLLQHLSGEVPNISLATQRSADLIGRYSDEYRRIQFIDSGGVALLGRAFVNGAVSDPITMPALFSETESAAFQQAIAAPQSTVVIGVFRLLAESEQLAASTVVLDLYTPVFVAGQSLGLVHLEVDATNLLAIVRLATRSTADAVLLNRLNRHVVLVDEQGRVLADSNAVGDAYLRNLDAVGGNATGNDLYEYLTALPSGSALFEQDLRSGYVFSRRTLVSGMVEMNQWQLFVVDQTLTVYTETLISISLIALLATILAITAVTLIRRQLIPLTAPVSEADILIQRLRLQAEQVEAPERARLIPPLTTSSVDQQMVSAVRTVSNKLDDISKSLEEQTYRRNRDLAIAGRIGREAAAQSDLEVLLQRAINLICNELGFYHAQVFLVDDSRTNAVLRASRGDAGRALLEKGHSLRVASATVIGTVTAQRRPVIVNDTQDTSGEFHGFNPLLPETRAEMGLPLLIGDEVIGALDIQSRNPHVFADDDIPTYQLLADQLAVAIYNARLREQSERRIEQIDRLNRRLTRDAWQEIEDRLDLKPQYGISNTRGTVKAPIAIRGEVIGDLEVDLPEGQQFNDADRMIMQAVADRVALAIENARLFQETQIALSETSTLYELSSRLNQVNALQDMVQTIISTIAPDASGGQVWLFTDSEAGTRREEIARVADYAVQPRESLMEGITTVQTGRMGFLQGVSPTATVFIEDIESIALEPDIRHMLRLMHAASLAVIPLNMRGEWQGFILIEFAQARRFNERDRRIFNALIAQAGVAIDNRLLFQQTETALTRQEKLYAASRLINTSEKLSDLVFAAVTTASNDALDFWLAMLEGETDRGGWYKSLRFVARSSQGSVQDIDETYTIAIPADSPLRRRVPEILNADRSGKLETDWNRWIDAFEPYQYLGIYPLFSDNNPIALFFLASRQNITLTPDDYEVYRALTGQMSTQIQNRRLLERTEAALNETRRLYVATRAISGAQDLTAIYDAVAGHLAMPFIQRRSLLERDLLVSIVVLTAYPDSTIQAPQLRYEYQWQNNPKLPVIIQPGTIFTQEDLPIASLIQNNDDSIVVYPDLANLPDGMPMLEELLGQYDATGAAIVPLWSRQRWFGALIIRTDHGELLDDDYARFAQAIADQVAIAMENQRLLVETEFERERLNSILSTLPTGVLVLDPETFEPLQHNQRAEELLGQPIQYNRAFTAGAYSMYRTGTNLVYPDAELPIYQAKRQNRQVLGDDIAVIHGIGQTDLLISAAPVYDANGNPRAIVAALQDISTLRSMENTMQENLRETVLLYETQRALSESETVDELLDNIIVQLAMQQPGDAWILVEDTRGKISVVRSLMQQLEDPEIFAPFLSAMLLNINDVERDTGLNEHTRTALVDAGVRSLLSLPLRSRSRTRPLGWLIVADPAPEAFTSDSERTLSSVADMASTAIDNSYLVVSTQEALQETAALYNATTAISRARDLQELFAAIAEAIDSLHPDIFVGFVMQDHVPLEVYRAGIDPDADLSQLPLIVTPDDENLYVDQLPYADASPLLDWVAGLGDIASFAVINLRVKDLYGGRIFIGYHQPTAFDENTQRFLGAVADSASVVIDNQLLLEQIQSTLQETSILYQASKALLETNNPTEIVDVIVNYLIEPHITQVFIALLNTASWDAPNAAVEIVAYWHQESDVDLLSVVLSPEQFPAWRQLSTPEVLTIEDIEQVQDLDDLEKISIESLGSRSLVIIPLRIPNREIGAIWLGSHEPHSYTDQDIRVYQAFAEQTSLTLEAARLLKQTDQRARQLETSATISQSVSQILDLDVLLPQVVDLIRDQFKYDHVQIFLMDDVDDYALLRASTGEPGKKLLSINHKLQKGSKSVIGQVTASGAPAIALDTAAANVVHKPNPYLPLTRSEMALPLTIKGEVVGALDVQSNQPNAFTDEDIQALTTLAAQIAVAIDNARLYEESRRRADEMGFLFEITTAAAAAETLEETLQQVANDVRMALRAETVAIYLPREYEDFRGNRKHMVEISAIAVESEQNITQTESIEIGDTGNLIGMVASGLQSQIVPSIEHDVRYYSISTEARSAAVVPITSASQLSGMIVLESRVLNAFDNDTLTLMLTLAGSLYAIIQNTLLLDRLRQTNEQLREVDRLKSQFLASMSHELRTPLNSIIGFSRVMLKGIDGPLTEMQEQDLNTIYNSGNHLLTLINDILDQAKIEANELNLKFNFFDIKPMVESVKSIAIGMLKEKSLSFHVEVAPNMPLAYGDEFRSRQILLNLVSNAIKFTPEGAVSIRAYAVEGEQGNMVRLDVVDTGIGIADKDMPILFEQFRQVDNSLTRTVGGTGLGLPISRSLAEMQGGQLVVQSTVGVGSVFSVLIPTYEGAESELERQREAKRGNRKEVEPIRKSEMPSGLISSADVKRAREQAENGENGVDKDDTQEFMVVKPEMARADMNLTQNIPNLNQKREVLLIEDNKEMVDQFRRTLQREGFEVQTADHPAYAEAMVGQLRPNVVLLDVNFAGGRGWELLKNLKERDDSFDIPVVVTTISDESERAYQLGAHTFIQRPFLPDDLVKAILDAERESQRERIVIIDDQPEAIRLLTQLLSERADFRVYSAQTGDEGISLVARRHPDLIILDLRMPGKDGFAVLDELRGNPETANIPVLVVTGDIDLSTSEQEALSNIRVLPKTDISQEEYEAFIDNVRSYLEANGRK